MSYSHGLVVGKFWPLHAGHSHLIETALSQCDRVTVELLVHPAVDIPLEVRADWIREIHPRVRLVWGMDDTPVDFHDPANWDRHIRVITSLLDCPVDAVFTSDNYGGELARRLNATWVQIDPGRLQNTVRAALVRAAPEAHWRFLHPAVRSYFVRRVVVTGAELTGSTTLAKALAAHLGCPWAPEYGRAWSARRAGGPQAPWQTEEFVEIAATQNALEEQAARSTPNRWLVCDTDALATTIWHERYIGRPSDAVCAVAHRQVAPFARILTGDEIAFVPDGLRDGETIRHAMQERFRQALAGVEGGGVPWIEVRGSRESRLAAALEFLSKLTRQALRAQPV